MKRKLKITMFLLILIIGWISIKSILIKPQNGSWKNNSFSSIYDKGKNYDVLLSGTSMVIANICNQELYSQYGIAAATLGQPEQPTYLSYYTIEEALKYQKPKAVIFDVQSIFYSMEDIREKLENQEYYYLHYSLDEMKNGMSKYYALKEARNIKKDVDLYDYYSSMYYSHTNWENLNKNNFSKVESNVINGDVWLTDFCQFLSEWKTYINEEEYSNEKLVLPEHNLVYLKKIIEICNQKGIELILVRSGGTGAVSWTWKQYNAINELAKEYDLTYLDVNVLKDEVGIDKYLDMGDGVHYNVVGSQKWTDYIGEYLMNKHSFTDKRNEKQFDYLKVAEKEYYNDIESVLKKQEYLKCVNLDEYLSKLCKENKSQYFIAISVQDEASQYFTEKEQKLLYEIGLKKGLLKQFRKSYVGIIDEGSVINEEISKKEINVSGSFNNGKTYEVSSGGYESNSVSSIKINDIEYGQNGRGINIVIYDKENDSLVSSVYFDTYLEKNPNMSIKKDEVVYTAIDVNLWEPEYSQM